MKKIILISFYLLLLFIIYVAISYLLLDGKVSYRTSFCSNDKLDSKKRDLFITDSLDIQFDRENVELKNIIENNDIWIEKHYIINYFGIIFNTQNEVKDYRKIRIEEKNIYKENGICCNILIEGVTTEKSSFFPVSQLATKIGNTVEYHIYDCKNEKIIGTIKIKVDK